MWAPGRDDHLLPPPSAERGPGGRGDAEGCRRARSQRPDVVSVGLVSRPCQSNPTSRRRGGSPHRGIDERPAGGLLFRRQDARARRSALPRRPLAGDPGRRGPYRRGGDRRTGSRPFWQRQRPVGSGGLRSARIRPRGLDVRRKGDRGDRQPGSFPVPAVADPGQQCGRGGRGGFHR